jgi:hypothetical protein
MGTVQRRARIALLAVLVSLSVSFPASRWAVGATPTQSGTQPQHLLIIRHAEKPNDKEDIHLTSRGAGRAAALPSLFLIPPTFPTKPSSFPTPDFLFATKKSKSSDRPVETVQPLSKALADMPIHHKYGDDEYQALVEHIFVDAKYAGKTVLVCWHHGKMPKLAVAVSKKAKNKDKLRDQIPKRLDDSVFDRVWQFTFDNQGSATFADRPQRLLFGDSKK